MSEAGEREDHQRHDEERNEPVDQRRGIAFAKERHGQTAALTPTGPSPSPRRSSATAC